MNKFLGCLAAVAILSCNQNEIVKKEYQWPTGLNAPICAKKPKELVAHGDKRIDDYYWLNDYFKKGPDSTAVVDYLKAENQYFDTMMAGTKSLQESLYNEMKKRFKEDDQGVPVFNNGYYYYSRVVAGKDYMLYCRKKGSLNAPEEMLIDGNALAEGKSYLSIGDYSISEDNKLMAYSIDTLSRGLYTIYFKNLETGDLLPDKIENTEGSAVWANDHKTVFYTSQNLITLLSEKIKRHTLGAADDALVYQEKDPSNYISVGKTKSSAYILISSSGTLSSESLILDANKPNDAFKVFQPRIKNVLYDVEHANNQFYIRTNYNALNFKVVSCSSDKTDTTHWKDVVPHNKDILVQGFDVFKNYLAVSERKDGLSQLHIVQFNNNSSHYLSFDDPTYDAILGSTPDYNSEVLRLTYTSLVTPSTVYDYNMGSKEKKVMKVQEIIGGYNKSQYVTEYLHAKAKDGTMVPISLVYKKGTKKDGTAPMHLYAYGSYGASMDAAFGSARLSLLDRGFIYAIAHIRGGEEMGRQWYEDGKMFKKKNTFTDFIDCAEYLIAQQYTSKEHLYASGASAGGLLMGAIINMRPDLFNGVIAGVPFVDVINTMSDASIPLTTNEYDEWGNPAIKEQYEYMKSYSPYDNVEKKAYPNLLVTTGLHDSQVQYFEPAKWVAKLRAYKTDKNILLLHTDMEAGHGGASGRYKALRDRAREFAFILALEGIGG